jgi:hypothetical protein
LPRSDQISAELIQAGGETLVYVIHKLINYIPNEKQSHDQQKESIIAQIYRNGVKG